MDNSSSNVTASFLQHQQQPFISNGEIDPLSQADSPIHNSQTHLSPKLSSAAPSFQPPSSSLPSSSSSSSSSSSGNGYLLKIPVVLGPLASVFLIVAASVDAWATVHQSFAQASFSPISFNEAPFSLRSADGVSKSVDEVCSDRQCVDLIKTVMAFLMISLVVGSLSSVSLVIRFVMTLHPSASRLASSRHIQPIRHSQCFIFAVVCSLITGAVWMALCEHSFVVTIRNSTLTYTLGAGFALVVVASALLLISGCCLLVWVPDDSNNNNNNNNRNGFQPLEQHASDPLPPSSSASSSSSSSSSSCGKSNLFLYVPMGLVPLASLLLMIAAGVDSWSIVRYTQSVNTNTYTVTKNEGPFVLTSADGVSRSVDNFCSNDKKCVDEIKTVMAFVILAILFSAFSSISLLLRHFFPNLFVSNNSQPNFQPQLQPQPQSPSSIEYHPARHAGAIVFSSLLSLIAFAVWVEVSKYAFEGSATVQTPKLTQVTTVSFSLGAGFALTVVAFVLMLVSGVCLAVWIPTDQHGNVIRHPNNYININNQSNTVNHQPSYFVPVSVPPHVVTPSPYAANNQMMMVSIPPSTVPTPVPGAASFVAAPSSIPMEGVMTVIQSNSQRPRFCSNCAMMVDASDTYRFCKNCGARIVYYNSTN